MSALKLKKAQVICVQIAEFGGDVTAPEVSAAHAGHDGEVLCEGGQEVSSVPSVFDPYLWN